MTRNTFNDFRIKDLAGGINLNSSPNEIDNKQCLTSLNFNFEGNKLINSRDKTIIDATDVANGIAGGTILGIDKIDNKVYFPVKNSSGTFGNMHYLNIDNSTGIYSYGGKLKIGHFIYTDSIVDGTTYSFTIQAYNGVTLLYTLYPTFTAGPTSTIDDLYNNLITDIKDGSNVYFFAEKGYVVVNGVEKYGIIIGTSNASGADNLTITSETNLTEVKESFVFDALSPTAKTIKSGLDLITLLPNGLCYYLQRFIGDTGSGSSQEGYYIMKINISPYDILYYNGKLLYCEEGDNTLYFSKTSSVTNPSLVREFTGYDAGIQKIGGDGKITGLLSGENGIYVFKEDEIYYSNSVQDDGVEFAFVFNRITNNGAKNPQCITRVGQDIFYYDGINRKIRRLSYEQNLTTLRDTAVSGEVDTIINSYGLQQNYLKLNYFYPNVKFYTQSNPASDNNDQCLTYNVNTKSWTTETVNVRGGNLNITFDDDYKLYLEEQSYKSSGEFISKEYDLWDAIDFKRFGEIEIYGKNTSDITLYLDVYNEGTLYETFTITNNYGDYFRERFDLYLDGRFIQFGIRYSGVGYLEINEVNFKYKPVKNFINYQG